MNRRSFLLLGAAALLVAPAATAPAARLPVSTVTVEILSVDRASFLREEYRATGGWLEKTTYVAKARIETVVNTEHRLSPGGVIDIRYDVRVQQPPNPYNRSIAASLKVGDTWTLTVFGGSTSFEWSGANGRKESRPDTMPSLISGAP
jgi:hypothetical protein